MRRLRSHSFAPACGPPEETANCLTAMVGMAASIVATGWLVDRASRVGTAWELVGCSVYGATLILLYSASTLYHAVVGQPLKRRCRLLDHACIYLLIAGTHTPFALTWLRGAWGWTLIGVIWGAAWTGIAFKAFGRRRIRGLSVTLYVIMGWTTAFMAQPLLERSPLEGILWLVTGGVVYTVGVVFFLFDELPYFHAVWHLFVLGGSACHYWAVAAYTL